MFSKRAAILLATVLVAGVALAQEAAAPAEYGRSGSELALVTKQPTQFHGSLGLTHSSLFGAKSYDGTVGGTLVRDRMWFFGSLQRNDAMRFDTTLPQIVTTPAAFGKIDAHLGDRQSLTAFAAGGQQLSPLTMSAVPSWFGTAHYTGIISSNAFFTASVSQSVAH